MGRSAVPIDFTLTPEQLRLRGDARAFARDVLSKVEWATRDLPTPLARFVATRPFYEQTVGAGFLRRLIPAPLGGQGTGIVDMAVLAEEFHAVDVNISLTLLGTMLGLFPVLLGGTPEQAARFFAPFAAGEGAPLAAFAFSEPGGSANFAAPAPAEGVRTQARLEGDHWVISGAKKWVSSGTGWDGNGADLLTVVCRTDPGAPPESGISVIAVSGPAEGIVLDRAIDSVGHRAHLQPQFRLVDVHTPADHLIGPRGGGKALAEACFTGTRRLLRRRSDACGLRLRAKFRQDGEARRRRAGHQPSGGRLRARRRKDGNRGRPFAQPARRPCLRYTGPQRAGISVACEGVRAETAVRVISDLMRVVGIDSYDRTLPLGGLLADALVLPLFDGGNMGVR
jgi:alkylation response protein AidB-like acyl-CoA dehydrogenase